MGPAARSAGRMYRFDSRLTFFLLPCTIGGMKPIHRMPASTARSIRWVLTDIDDTMTKNGKLESCAYTALCDLASSGLPVIAVTGRSSGWGEVHLQEWPIVGAVTENGAIAWHSRGSIVAPDSVPNTDSSLVRAAEAAYRAVPRAKPASDNNLRRYDYAIDHAERIDPPLTGPEISAIIAAFEAEGCVAKPSSIHINCWKGSCDKQKASVHFLSEVFGYADATDRDKVLYIGDALNDEPMFAHFPNACAVANVSRWLDHMTSRPAWIAEKPYGQGFAEIAQIVLAHRSAECL